jgi:hypothetical protein
MKLAALVDTFLSSFLGAPNWKNEQDNVLLSLYNIN